MSKTTVRTRAPKGKPAKQPTDLATLATPAELKKRKQDAFAQEMRLDPARLACREAARATAVDKGNLGGTECVLNAAAAELSICSLVLGNGTPEVTKSVSTALWALSLRLEAAALVADWGRGWSMPLDMPAEADQLARAAQGVAAEESK